MLIAKHQKNYSFPRLTAENLGTMTVWIVNTEIYDTGEFFTHFRA